MTMRGGEANRVLVVDDEVAVARMVARWLQRAGVVVEVAHSPREATELADRFACDLVISDINMPDGSGLDLARWFKERDATIQVEADHVRTHPAIGEQILRPMLEDGVILDIVRHHHERWDGRGYPDRLTARSRWGPGSSPSPTPTTP